MEIQFAVCSDLFDAGACDDGTRFEGLRYYVQAEFPNGQRFRYFKEWDGVKATPNYEDGGNFFEDVRPRAIALAEAVCRTVAKDKFDPTSNLWFEDRPCYGSDAFLEMQAESVMMEREEFDAGFNACYR